MAVITNPTTTYLLKFGNSVSGATYYNNGGEIYFTLGSNNQITGISGQVLGNTIASLVSTGTTIHTLNWGDRTVSNQLFPDNPYGGFVSPSSFNGFKFIAFTDTLGAIYNIAGFTDYFDGQYSVIQLESPTKDYDYQNFGSDSGNGISGSTVKQLIGTSSADSITGTIADEIIVGLQGDDTITLGGGNDTIDGGEGTDTIVTSIPISSTNFVISYNDSSKTFALLNGSDLKLNVHDVERIKFQGDANSYGLIGGSQNADVLNGTVKSDFIYGGAGDDTIDGLSGADRMVGGIGNDAYIVDNLKDYIEEGVEGGSDTVKSSVTYILGDYIENLTLTASAKINGTGNALPNVISGNDNDNLLDGKSGNDTINGNAGNDTITVGYGYKTIDGGAGSADIARFTSSVSLTSINLSYSSDNSSINAYASVGTDTLSATIKNVEKFTFFNGTTSKTYSVFTALTATVNGSSGQDILLGGVGNDTLDGLAGADYMNGGSGNDTYIVDNVGDVIKEDISGSYGGTDVVKSSLTFTLASLTNVENLTLTGSGAISGTGNSGNNYITGNSGNNTLDGGTGNDTLEGGQGNDYYVVDSIGDVVKELTGAGTDTVFSSINYTLPDNVENLSLSGVGDLAATGNGLGNIIIGNSGNNSLNGGLGKDTLTGGDGIDHFIYNDISSSSPANIDTINDFKTGVDKIDLLFNISSSNSVAIVPSFTGLAGQITFSANKLSIDINGDKTADYQLILTGVNSISPSDILVPNLNQGNPSGGGNQSGGTNADTVDSSLSYTLSDNQKNLNLTGTAEITGTGNALANYIVGNRASNTIDGGAGADTMAGGQGNDVYYVDSYVYDVNSSDSHQGANGDVIKEDESRGTDTIIYSAKSIFYELPANVENFTMMGSGKISLTANNLNNVIVGGSGSDTLLGGLGRDTLTGGQGNDRYSYNDVAESTPNNQDTITDFQSGADKILLLFSNSPLSSVNLVSSFSGVAGEMVFKDTMLAIDINGDKTEDFKLTLVGVTQIQASDIQLTVFG